MGSFIAVEALNDGKLAEEFATEGIKANRNNSILLNNLAVSLALQGKPEEAEEKVARAAKHSDNSSSEQIALKATEGLIHYRKHDPIRGRHCYAEAMRLAKMKKEFPKARVAALYMAQEELVAATRESRQIAELVLSLVKAGPSPESHVLIERIDRLKRQLSTDAGELNRDEFEMIAKAVAASI